MFHLPCQLLPPPLCSSSSLQLQLGCCRSLSQLWFDFSVLLPPPTHLFMPCLGELLWAAFQFSNSLFSFSSCQFFISIDFLFQQLDILFPESLTNSFLWQPSIALWIDYSLPGRHKLYLLQSIFCSLYYWMWVLLAFSFSWCACIFGTQWFQDSFFFFLSWESWKGCIWPLGLSTQSSVSAGWWDELPGLPHGRSAESCPCQLFCVPCEPGTPPRENCWPFSSQRASVSVG